MTQGAPPNVDTLIQWCCDEMTSAGLVSVTGVNANGSITTAGTYTATATVVVGLSDTNRVNPTIMLETDDSATNLNTVGGLPLSWSTDPMNGADGWLWVVSDPTVITALFSGEARITVSVEAVTGSATPTADEVDVFVTKNGVALPGVAALKFNYSGGVAHGQVVTVDPTVVAGDVYEVVGQAAAAVVGSVALQSGVLCPNTFWVAERTTAPTITASLQLFDSTDTLVDVIDEQTVQAFGYAFSLGGVFGAQSGFLVKCFVTHDDAAETKSVDDESHMDVVKEGGFLTWATC